MGELLKGRSHNPISTKGDAMKKHAVIGTMGLALLAWGIALGSRAQAVDSKPADNKASAIRVGPYHLSGPYTQGNLTIFLIHGPDQLKGKNLLTLQEALEQKKAIVHETQNVNQLSIENVSADMEIFVQSGDIVKGGQQDRAIAYDMVLPPKSGKVPLASFCVEQGRWTRRGREEVSRFESSDKKLPSKEGKIAVKGGGQSGARGDAQNKVWMEVARRQAMLSRALGKSVKSAQSGSSLQLTLEDKKLLQTVATYSKNLSGMLKGKNDVVGFAFAINGQINSADIFASSALFRKLWPPLLEATVIEAIAELQKDKKFPEVKARAIKAFMQDADQGKSSNQEVTKRIRMVTQETKKNLLYKTEDRQQKGLVLHKNYIAK
jgi:hypothetical protein